MTPVNASKMANLGEQDQQRPSRPPIYSHHPNSVPSTPYQQPRGLRFHSRSPSPNRVLSAQSPRSVVSDAVGPTGAQRLAPVVCKFETGAEIRKRRIPYVEGGNEELGPPKKEPKKALEPDEHEKLSGDMRELYDRILPSQESERRRKQLVTKLERILNEEWPGYSIKVHVFGSSGNDLSSSDSDVDICITTPQGKLDMHAIAGLLHKSGMEKVVCRASAKVPIVKCWDPELELAADLNVNNTLALENTRMIKTYVHLDDRVRPLAKVIKHWTKMRVLNDAAFGGTISSYTWICMIINFLQKRKPPILPSLQQIAASRNGERDQDQIKFADDVENIRGYGDANKETLAELLFHFFRHYAYEFAYSKYVVSIREGRALSRKEKGWDPSNYQDKEARNRLCVEEPFTVNRNLGNSADDYAWSGIHGEIRRAFDLLADGAQLDKCCEQFVFPPEEKPIFQRPAPKPKPTLTRSASQSGRPNHEPGTGRSKKGGNRNQSSQRSGNRRASSGATFSNQRVPLPFQSPPGGPIMDYFNKGDLHNQLYQQYQYLQAQQDALQRQLQQSAAAQAQSQGRSSEASGSPLSRAYSNGLPSPRFMEHGPPTAPLLPGYLWHYPSRYPPPSPMSQARSREGSSTNPSSPSMSTAVPSLRRQAHRGPVPEGSASLIRSQSQPGRSLPHPLTAQQQAHPGYDVSGALGGQTPNGRPLQAYPQGPLGIHIPFSPPGVGYAQSQPPENAMPKEYIGYYVGQSPSLGPQYHPVSQAQMPTMMLRDPPLPRPRRVTPDLGPPLANGQLKSRSPSPMGSSWRATVESWQNAQTRVAQSPQQFEVTTTSAQRSTVLDTSGPLIVNGSRSASLPHLEAINGVHDTASSTSSHQWSLPIDEEAEVLPLPIRPALDTNLTAESLPVTETTPSSPQTSSGLRTRTGSKVTFSPHGTTPNGSHTPEAHPADPSTPAPLLSPVAELRTPSPTRSPALDRASPKTNGFVKAANIANARQAESENAAPPIWPTLRHERKGSAPNPTTPAEKPPAPAKSPPLESAPLLANTTNSQINTNPWQQATRKGHKKSKSAGGAKSTAGFGGGQPLPASESERKGG